MSDLDDILRGEFQQAAGLPVTNLEPIAENKYCRIFRANCDGQPAIFKKYLTGDAGLARLESNGVDFYHRVVATDPRFLDSKSVAISDALRVVGVGFVPGGRLADAIYAAARRPADWDKPCTALRLLAELLRRFREQSLAPGKAMDPFHEEYLLYCSRRLEQLPVLGSKLFAGYELGAEKLLRALEASGEAPSFAHGDFVFRNMHLDGDRIGLIDFANNLRLSHPLNDLMNLWFALNNMPLPTAFRDRLWGSVLEGYGPAGFAPEAEHFFYEYHRRRWLMLNLRTRDPRRWIRAARAMARHARPYDAARRLVP